MMHEIQYRIMSAYLRPMNSSGCTIKISTTMWLFIDSPLSQIICIDEIVYIDLSRLSGLIVCFFKVDELCSQPSQLASQLDSHQGLLLNQLRQLGLASSPPSPVADEFPIGLLHFWRSQDGCQDYQGLLGICQRLARDQLGTARDQLGTTRDQLETTRDQLGTRG